MNQKVMVAAVALLLVVACKPGTKPDASKSGPVVAKGEGVTITADELKARIDEQSPFVRSRFNALDQKKELLDNLVRFELLAREAEKQGLAKDPDVQLMVKRMMVQKLVQKSFAESGEPASAASDDEARKYFEAHQEEFHRPAKVRVSQLLVKAPAEGPERAKKEAAARVLLAKIRVEEPKAPGAFLAAARQASEDDASKATGGDLGFRSKEELGAQVGQAAADAAFGMKDGELSDVLAGPHGFVLLKRTGWQDPVDRAFDTVKPQIQAKLGRERRTKDFDALVQRLKDQAKVSIDEKELENIQVAAAPTAPTPGPGGAGPGLMTGAGPGSGHGPMGGALPPGMSVPGAGPGRMPPGPGGQVPPGGASPHGGPPRGTPAGPGPGAPSPHAK